MPSSLGIWKTGFLKGADGTLGSCQYAPRSSETHHVPGEAVSLSSGCIYDPLLVCHNLAVDLGSGSLLRLLFVSGGSLGGRSGLYGLLT